ncbi:MAG: hypothetical protein GY679_01340 [Mycoplasma sp.]|nr:hypothetical protein [Mycoplasma sp.]
MGLLTKIYDFMTPSEWDYDTNLIEQNGNNAQLKFQDDAGQTFTQDFVSDVGFTYDNTKAEFTGGTKIQQKPYVYADEMMGVSVVLGADADRSVGSATATANNGAALTTIGSNQYLDTSGSIAGKTWSYDFNNANFFQTGCIRFKVITNYIGTPAANRFMLTIDGAGGANAITLFHQATGALLIRINNQAGALAVQTTLETNWSPDGVNEDEIELNFDFAGGTSRYYINGVQTTGFSFGTFARGAITSFDVGGVGVGSSDFFIRDLQVFDEVQHTTNFPLEIPRFVPNFYGSVVELPQFTYSGTGGIQSFDSYSTTEIGIPKYILNGQYWNGSLWTPSNGTYLQANIEADILANISTLSPLNTLDVKLVFDDTIIINEVSDLNTTYTGQIYPTTNPTITKISGLSTDGIATFVSSKTITGSDEVKYILIKDDVEYYYNAGWVTSDGTYAQSNPEAEVSTNITTFVTTTAVDFKLKIFLHSDDGSTTPQWETTTVEYDFAPTEPTLNETIIWGWLRDIASEKTETVTVQPRNDLFGALTYIQNDAVNVTVNVDGSFEVVLIYETSEPTELIWTFGSKTIVTNFLSSTTVNFNDLTRV